MLLAHDDSYHGQLTPLDDAFHPATNDRFFHETAWFWWFIPEEKIGGWMYHWIRPNIGTSGGGVWVWDSSTYSHFEVPYYLCYANQPLDPDDDLRDHTYASGARVECTKPLSNYRLTFRDRDVIDLDLSFEAALPPWAGKLVTDTSGHNPHIEHIDQLGRVTGSMQLHGTQYVVDCLAIRDRTWATRSEKWKHGHVGYSNAASSEGGVAFLAHASVQTRDESVEHVNSGYFVRDGRRAAIVAGSRTLERNSTHGYLERITVVATDSFGRTFEAIGTSVSRMAMPIPGVHGVVWTSLVDWTIDGVQAWGEDQDAWPIQSWSEFRRSINHHATNASRSPYEQ